MQQRFCLLFFLLSRIVADDRISCIVTKLVILWLKRHNCNSNFNFVSAVEKKGERFSLGFLFDLLVYN